MLKKTVLIPEIFDIAKKLQDQGHIKLASTVRQLSRQGHTKLAKSIAKNVSQPIKPLLRSKSNQMQTKKSQIDEKLSKFKFLMGG
jgi:hypothetical protein